MKKVAAIFLVFALLVSLSACGNSGDPLVGSWEGTMDMTSYVGSMLQEILAIDGEVEPMELKMTFTFTKDGVFSCVIDENSAAQMFDTMLRIMARNLPITGMTEDDVYAMLEEQMNMEDVVGSITDSFVDCFYVYQDGCIYTGFDQTLLKEDPAANSVMTWQVSVQKKTLTVNQITLEEGQLLSEKIPGILPMTFAKK